MLIVVLWKNMGLDNKLSINMKYIWNHHKVQIICISKTCELLAIASILRNRLNLTLLSRSSLLSFLVTPFIFSAICSNTSYEIMFLCTYGGLVGTFFTAEGVLLWVGFESLGVRFVYNFSFLYSVLSLFSLDLSVPYFDS